MVTPALALRESLAPEKSGVGTLSIIHHLHLLYIQKNGERGGGKLLYTSQLTFRLHRSETNAWS